MKKAPRLCGILGRKVLGSLTEYSREGYLSLMDEGVELLPLRSVRQPDSEGRGGFTAVFCHVFVVHIGEFRMQVFMSRFFEVNVF